MFLKEGSISTNTFAMKHSDIELRSFNGLLILLYLARHKRNTSNGQGLTGYAISKEIKIPSGIVYPLLHQLMGNGLATRSVCESTGKGLYDVSDKGKGELEKLRGLFS